MVEQGRAEALFVAPHFSGGCAHPLERCHEGVMKEKKETRGKGKRNRREEEKNLKAHFL